ncbi:AAA family ATPase [Photobacterium atrarenae]|uniref:AAA family ATPase n=1 Tax=Photobacterium atrarenae TaxID=865757 RepID=A0ABY5GB54_9GAMM|nr:ATP-binding protein [Photobacterium atrarenae]UTV26400.1 AAA family ATPase [Photobacterium atrarenae]
MHLTELEILNLWGKDKISLSFKNNVTFLTGINGTGKSTILNIIYDTLNLKPEKGMPSTSKYRFWSSKASFDNDVHATSLLLPNDNGTKEHQEIEKVVSENESLHDLNVINKFKDIYCEDSKSNVFNNIHYSNDLKGEITLKELHIPVEIRDELTSEYGKGFFERPMAFLFQEDRSTLHNVEKSNIDFSLHYWNLYRSSIDDRFAYLRDGVQIYESHINQAARAYLEGEDISVDEIEEIKRKSSEIRNVILKLNSYLSESHKEVVRDEDNKITLREIGSDEPISWHLLSRGEKTLLYIFFVVFLYRSKVRVFLFDEPEISLHVKWQRNLIKDLSELAPNNQFIIATHSPSLVQKGWLPNCLELTKG